ncbi:hypothetical protein GCM10007084_45020 [Parabacteroides faecis]|nr:hypothetical protein GCM10007084_45020 [Parabacteroides faecis]
MGLKSEEINYLLIRQLKQTANKPVIIKPSYSLDSSIISKLAHWHIATLAYHFLFIP